MANEIVNFDNSFIGFGDEAPETCNDFNRVRLPIFAASDIGCMFKITNTTEVYVESLRIFIIRGTYAPAAIVPASAILKEVVTYGSALISGSDYLAWAYDDTCTETPLSEVTYPPTDGECLKIALLIDATKEMVATSAQEFYYKPDPCFTNLVIYKCNENSFGFLYETADETFYNQIRLPIALINPKPLTEKSGFRKSDGRFLTLSATKSKEWEVEVDMLTDHVHQCLDCAIDHDILYISENTVVDCEYQEYYRDPDDKYDIDWTDGEGVYLGVAKAKFKLRTNPYYSTNNNC